MHLYVLFYKRIAKIYSLLLNGIALPDSSNRLRGMTVQKLQTVVLSVGESEGAIPSCSVYY